MSFVAHLTEQFYRIPLEEVIPPGYKHYAGVIIEAEITKKGELAQANFYPHLKDGEKGGEEEDSNKGRRLGIASRNRWVIDINRGSAKIGYALCDFVTNTLAHLTPEESYNPKIKKGAVKAADYMARLSDMGPFCEPLRLFFKGSGAQTLTDLLWGLVDKTDNPSEPREDLIERYLSGTPLKFMASQTRLYFSVQGCEGFLHQQEEAEAYWKQQLILSLGSGQVGYVANQGGMNELAEIAQTHPRGLKIGRLEKALAIASANEDAFCQQGLKKTTCAGLTPMDAYRYTTALQYLAQHPRHHDSIGKKLAVVFWSSENGGEDCLWDGCLKPDSGYVEALLKVPLKGKKTPHQQDGVFHMLSISNNSERAVINDYYFGTLSDVRANLALWCQDIEVPSWKGQTYIPSLYNLCKAHLTYAPQDKMSDWITKITREAALMLNAALRGLPLPVYMAERVLRTVVRQIANRGTGTGKEYITSAQMGLLQVVHNRNPHRKYGRIMTTSDNYDEIQHPAFHLGRKVFFMLDTQYAVMRHTNDMHKLLKQCFVQGRFDTAYCKIVQRYITWCSSLKERARFYSEKTAALDALILREGWVVTPPKLSTSDKTAFICGFGVQQHEAIARRQEQAKKTT